MFHATLMTAEKLYLTNSEISYKIKDLCSLNISYFKYLKIFTN